MYNLQISCVLLIYCFLNTLSPCLSLIPEYECSVENSTHTVDLSHLKLTDTNHYTVRSSGIIIINVCAPIHIHNGELSLPCTNETGICIKDVSTQMSLDGGKPMTPPYRNRNGYIVADYVDGSVCEDDVNKNYSSQIIFKCDRDVELGSPVLFPKKSQSCHFTFLWKTVLVCREEPLHAHDCIFEDDLTNSSVDMTKILGNITDLTIPLNRKKKQNFFFNICNSPKNDPLNHSMTLDPEVCDGSAVCVNEQLKNSNESDWINLGNVNDAVYTFQGESLFLRFFNGSACNSSSENLTKSENSTSKTWSTEIEIICHNHSGLIPKIEFKSVKDCKVSFLMMEDNVCNLVPPKCTYRVPSNETGQTILFDLRELSSRTHAWNVSDPTTDEVYYINMCRSIPVSMQTASPRSAAVKCSSSRLCLDIGLTETFKFSYESSEFTNSSQALVVTYRTHTRGVCSSSSSQVNTKIVFICDKVKGQPVLIKKADKSSGCEFVFLWRTYSACPFPEDLDIPLQEEADYHFWDPRATDSLGLHIDLGDLFKTTPTVSGDKYEFSFDFSGSNKTSDKCKKAAICQRNSNEKFARDIGSRGTEQLVIRGNVYVLQFECTNDQKCGKNANKNVTSHIFLECDPDDDGDSEPEFLYENENCDYYFTWRTNLVCRQNMISFDDTHEHIDAPSEPEKAHDDIPKTTDLSSKALKFFVGFSLLVVISLTVVFFYYNNYERFHLVEWVRSKLRTSSPTLFHYSQVSSDTAKLVTLSQDQDL
ncbi:lysosomal enzyme receptor protein [Brevipalpus obovatus]|uniref:lysosomal enzyme receptor protein n=1 Tax=Brevipalpus obovatus TaxID=246614 RepID=UPI003D9FA485